MRRFLGQLEGKMGKWIWKIGTCLVANEGVEVVDGRHLYPLWWTLFQIIVEFLFCFGLEFLLIFFYISDNFGSLSVDSWSLSAFFVCVIFINWWEIWFFLKKKKICKHSFSFQWSSYKLFYFRSFPWTGSADRTVKFWDLETFELIGSAGPEVSN